MKRRTALRTLGAVTVAAAVTGGVVLLGDPLGGAPGSGAAGRSGDAPPATATVVRTDLVRAKTVDGTLDFAQRRPVKSAVVGTVTVAATEGRTVTRGQALYELDDKPVTLLYGPVPVFREMKTGDRGSDVLQLERNLRDLGHGAGLYVDTRYDKDTETAVKRWQKSLNREPTGRVGKGEVVFQPGQVKVVSADAALADQVGPDRPVLTVASTRPVVRARLDQTDGPLTAAGTKVEVTLPSGRTAAGRVAGTVRPEDTGTGTARPARTASSSRSSSTAARAPPPARTRRRRSASGSSASPARASSRCRSRRSSPCAARTAATASRSSRAARPPRYGWRRG